MHAVEIDGQSLNYEVLTRVSARRVGVRVHAGGRITVTVPSRVSETVAHTFIRKNLEWLKSAYVRARAIPARIKLPRGTRDYQLHKERARALIHARLRYFNSVYGFSYNRISIKNQSSRWGSCSRKGNLNFSYKLIHVPPELLDYVVVHELCHLVEFNHSRRFWDLVAKALPEHKILRKRLQSFAL